MQTFDIYKVFCIYKNIKYYLCWGMCKRIGVFNLIFCTKFLSVITKTLLPSLIFAFLSLKIILLSCSDYTVFCMVLFNKQLSLLILICTVQQWVLWAGSMFQRKVEAPLICQLQTILCCVILCLDVCDSMENILSWNIYFIMSIKI